jgi:hypothetical protein
MSDLTLDQSTIQKLKFFATSVQIRDPEGNVIGVFRPAPRIYKEGEVPEFTEEELQRSESGEKISSDEVARRLRSQS